MESEMTGIIVAVLADSKDKLIDNEESILKITYADEDTTAVENELKGLGLIQVCSEDDSLVRVEDDEFKTHWYAPHSLDGECVRLWRCCCCFQAFDEALISAVSAPWHCP